MLCGFGTRKALGNGCCEEETVGCEDEGKAEEGSCPCSCCCDDAAVEVGVAAVVANGPVVGTADGDGLTLLSSLWLVAVVLVHRTVENTIAASVASKSLLALLLSVGLPIDDEEKDMRCVPEAVSAVVSSEDKKLSSVPAS